MKYTEEHDWLRVEGELVVVGITKFATEQLGDVVFVELPDPGTLVSRGDEIAVIESAKTASEILAMYDGEIVAVNEALVETPSLVNEDPTGAAWFFKIKLADMAVLDGLMDEDAQPPPAQECCQYQARVAASPSPPPRRPLPPPRPLGSGQWLHSHPSSTTPKCVWRGEQPPLPPLPLPLPPPARLREAQSEGRRCGSIGFAPQR